MRSRGAKSRTADLFAPAVAPVLEPPPAPAPAPAPASAPLAAALPVSRLSSAPARVLPVPLHGVRPRQLWYAVVFPDLLDSDITAAATLQRLCVQAQQFTSLVSIELPNALLLEIKGSVKLFGSLHRLLADIDAVWVRLQLRAYSATAPTTLAALWFARAAKPVCIEEVAGLVGPLAGLPLACTAWDPERLQTLRSMGVGTLGELLRLPRGGVARRFSPTVLRDLDIALARQAAPRRGFIACERFRERCDFESEIETVLYLEKAIEPVIDRCATFLRERQAGVQTLELRLRHRALAATRVRMGLASVTSDRRRLCDVLVQKLSRLELAAPVRAMLLLSGPLQPLSANSLDAFAGATGGGGCDTAPQLVERLRARLGEQCVYGVSPVAEHRPEAAWQRVQELLLTGTVRIMGDGAGFAPAPDHLPRPVWLLANPQPLQRDELILEQGPERIESGWWDGKGVARDYYIARRSHGPRWWIFQERQTKSWYLHGVFA